MCGIGIRRGRVERMRRRNRHPSLVRVSWSQRGQRDEEMYTTDVV